MPLAIQDRLFNEDGSIYLNTGGNNPETHPNWNPEYFGDVMIVNGKAWPNLPVDRGAYRFRLLNGCDSRFLDLVLTPESDPTALVTWTMIGTEQGFLRSATAISGIAIAPGERVDVLVDFSAYPAGTKFILRNSAPSPYPMGE
jgi:FtsP/CotA-like multicopper oxidase with cupredoxin domain